MPFKPAILPPLPDLPQKHSPAPLRERILTNSRRALDGAFRVGQRSGGSGEGETAVLWLLFCRRRRRRVVVLGVHEVGLLRAIAGAGRGRGRAMDVGAAGREWRGNLGQKLEALMAVVVGDRRLVRLGVERRGEHCFFVCAL